MEAAAREDIGRTDLLTPLSLSRCDSLLAAVQNDAALFDHNRRFQAAVLRTMEVQMARMEAATLAKETALHQSETVREDLAVGFAQMKAELTRINKTYTKTSGNTHTHGWHCASSGAHMLTQVDAARFSNSAADLRQSTHSHATLQNENLHLKSELHAAQKQSATLTAELSRMRQDLSTTRDELHAGKQLHGVFSSDLVMHRQLKETMAAEVRSLQTELKTAHISGEEQHGRWEKKEAECGALRLELSQQCKQTSLAQAELERVVNELSMLKASRDVMSKQWEGALTAMQKRDATMSTVAAKRNAAESEALSLRNAETALTQEVTSLRANAVDMQSKMAEQQQRWDDLSRAHEDLRRSHTELTRAAEDLSEEKGSVDQSAAGVAKQNALLSAENQRLVVRATQLRDEAALLKSQLADQIELTRSIDRSVKSGENTLLTKTETHNSELQRRVAVVDNERQSEVNRSVELAQQLKDLARSNAMLNDEHAGTCSKLDILSRELSALHTSLDHMTYRANKAESESTMLRTRGVEDRRAESQSLAASIRNLETELNRRTTQVAQMNQAFVLAEEKVLEAHRQHSEVTTKTERLRSELRKAEGVQDRLRSSVEELSKENIGMLKENNLHRLAVKKHAESVSVLSAENTTVRGQLLDADFLFQQRELTHESELRALKQEVLRAREKKGATIGVLEESERAAGVWQRKFERLTLQHTALQNEMQSLSQQFFAQRSQLQASQKEQSMHEKQFAAWMKSFEHLSDKQFSKRMAPGAVGGPRGAAKLTFSASQNLTAQQVLDNFAQTAASLPANSATFATSAGAGGGNGGGSRTGATRGAGANIMGASSGAQPALDSLQDMVSHIGRNGGGGGGGGNGSQSARGGNGNGSGSVPLSDSDSRSSLLTRDMHGGKCSTFHEGLVSELRTALHKTSTQAAERLQELVKIKADMKALLRDQTSAASREHDLMARVHLLATQQQSLSMNVILAESAFTKAQAMCASFERQLREAHRQIILLSAGNGAIASEQKDGSSTERSSSSSSSSRGVNAPAAGGGGAICTIDYELYPELEPSPLLRNILHAPLKRPLSEQDSMQSLSAFASSSSSSAGTEESKSLQQHGRGGRVGLGRPSNSRGSGGVGTGLQLSYAHPGQLTSSASKGIDGFSSSSGSIGSSATGQHTGHSGIASTVSLLSSNASSAAIHSSSHRTASAAQLPQYQYRAGQIPPLSASAAALHQQQQSPPSQQQSYANLPFHIRPTGK